MLDPRRELAAELTTYQDHKEELLASAEHRFVLIKGADILGTFDSKLDAVAAGHERIGPGPFLVKKIERVERIVRILSPRF